MTKLEKQVWAKLNKVLDPELNISLVDLGLIYKVSIDNDQANITMTLTTIGCPLFPVIEQDLRKKVLELSEINKLNIKLVFEPVWTMDKMSESAKIRLGLL